MPAFKINESTFPNALTDSLIILLHESKLVMSVFIAIELPPLLLISFESWLRTSIFRDANTTFDVFASFTEIDFPIPDEAPVTIYVDLEIFISQYWWLVFHY